MKQVLQSANSLAVVRDVPAPACPHGGVLVRNCFSVISSGTERARVELAQKSMLGKARERPDLVREVVNRARREGVASTLRAVQHRMGEESTVGYSSAGRVIEVGPGVTGLRPGDAVACAGGGHANHAEIIAVPRNLCARVPANVSLQPAAFSTIAAIALHGLHLAEASVGERVAVIGCGLVGQITCRLLACAGAMTIALDIDQGRVQEAVRGGADHGLAIDESTVEQVIGLCDGVGADKVLVTAGSSSNDPLLLAAAVARDRGSIVLVGAVPIEFPRAPLYDKELSFRVSRSYGPGRYDLEYEERGLDYPIGYVRWTEQRNMEAVLGLLARGTLRLDDLIGEVIPVDEAPRAYELLAGGSETPLKGALVLSYDAEDQTDDVPRPSVLATPPTSPPATNGSTESGKRARPVRDAPRIGLIGPGGFATRVIVPALVQAGASLEVVGGGGGPSAEAARRRLGFGRVATSEQQVLEDPNVDAVVICTRHGSHAALAAAALDAGKHVFCEKPLGLTEEEIERVMAAAARDGAGVLAVGFNRRFSPQLIQARTFLGPGHPLLASYRVSAGDLSSDHWVHDLAQGGGRVLGEAGHFLDSLVYLAGSPIVEVHAYGYGQAGLPIQAHDRVVVNLRFGSGSVGSIVYVADGSPKVPKERLEAFSGSRTVTLDDYTVLELADGPKRSRKRLRTQDKGHAAELQAFVDGVRGGEAPVPLAEIRNVSLATLAIVESLRRGTPISVHLVVP